MRRPLEAYVGLLVAVAAPLVALVLLRTPWSEALADPWTLAVLAALVVLGELRPILVSHGDGTVDLVTISCCFSLALVLDGPLGTALAVQAVALLLDDLHARRPLIKALFHQANLALSLLAARATYALTTQHDLLASRPEFGIEDLPGALLAGAVFYVVNQCLTTTVICLAGRTPWLPSLRRDLVRHATSYGVLLALSPVIVHAVELSPLLVLLLLMPLAAVHASARLAVERERQALHDHLTGLPNRALFEERVDRALRQREDDVVAVMLLDLDHFKDINDTLGHHVGDQLLVAVAGRLREAVREEDLVARLGGDEFAVLCLTADAATAEALAERVVRATESSYVVDGVRLDVGSSVGLSLAPQHGDHPQTLLQRADVALYAAKVQRGTWARYAPEADGHAVERLALLGDLRSGVGRGELVVEYQPVCDARSGAVLSVEALVRWRHPTRGLLPPDGFLHLAESSGLVAVLTEEVLGSTLDQLVRWEAAGLRLTASVNLSARLLTDLELPARVAAALAARGLAPDRLVLEVTESQLLADVTRADVVLRRLRDAGVGLAVDDFGTGYSSLAQLRSLALDVLKVDASLVQGLASDDGALVRSTVRLGHDLGLRVVAEGVEDAASLDRLRALGCDAVQGYYLCRPLSGDEVLAWARTWDGPPGPVEVTLRRLVQGGS